LVQGEPVMGSDGSSPSSERREVPDRAKLIDLVFGSLSTPDAGNQGETTVSREVKESNPDDPDATLSYSVGREGGGIGPWMDADEQRRLRDAFGPGSGSAVQGRYRVDRELVAGAWGWSSWRGTCGSTVSWR
jgi:hypothetical protein